VKKTSTSEIWAEFGDRLRRFIAKRIGQKSDVDDVLQDVFSKVHEGLAVLEDPGKLEPWLFQVTRRVILDHYRRRAGRRRPTALRKDLAAAQPAPAIMAELALCLKPMVERLSDGDREAIRLSETRGVLEPELGRKLGLSKSGAKSRLQRARRHLREMLYECCQFEMDRRGSIAEFTPRRSCDSCSCP
jgi:RNA polymerase sigma-70 factor (ECF subfamily)